MRELFEKVWYERHPASTLLAPIAWLYRFCVAIRRAFYRSGLLSSYRAPVPVIVVGNLTVGGTGKTPLVIWLAEFLRASGFKPGIISRGYRGRAKTWPQQVRADGDPETVGDEAIVLARRTGCPIAVGPSRADSVEALMRHADCDIVISDDGLQHYRLERDVEILVVDGIRRFGNGRCLPAGPLREPLSRLNEISLTVNNGIASRGEFEMKTQVSKLHSLTDSATRIDFESFVGKAVNAVAGVGNPERFFEVLRQKGMRVIKHAFPDHHRYLPDDLKFDNELPIIMTEKDAVKCERLNLVDAWYLPIDVILPKVFEHRLNAALEEAKDG
ncbi:MAG: tetraacyldisaccharide 4'-kinase [Gammaproteobacteria bacterium]